MNSKIHYEELHKHLGSLPDLNLRLSMHNIIVDLKTQAYLEGFKDGLAKAESICRTLTKEHTYA